MTTTTEYTVGEFCDRYRACTEGCKWAASHGGLKQPMLALWARNDLRYEWRRWIATRPGVCTDSDLRLFACRCVRQTPLADGRTVWHLLDAHSCKAVETAERFARGEATADQLSVSRTAAKDAAWASGTAALAAVEAASENAGLAWNAARAAAWSAAGVAWSAAGVAWSAAGTAARAAAWNAAEVAQNGFLCDVPVSFAKEVTP